MRRPKVDKRLKWLLPYLDRVGNIVPVRKIARIGVVSNNRKRKDDGQVVNRNGQFYLTINHYNERAEDVLHTFAHELAHCVRPWSEEHTPEHLKMTGLLFWLFTCHYAENAAGAPKDSRPRQRKPQR